MEHSKGLPGWLFAIAGIAIMLYTKFIQARAPDSKIGIFFWVGLALVVFGILREVASRMNTKKPAKELVGPPPRQAPTAPAHTQPHPAMHARGMSPHTTHTHVAPQQHPSHPYQPQHKQCPRCMQLTHGHGRFCSSCGHRFF